MLTKHILTTAAALTILVPSALANDAPTSSPITPVTTIEVSDGTTLIEVTNNEARVENNIIREFAIGKNITVAYKNTTEKTVFPKYTLKAYNRYGLLLGEKSVGGGLIFSSGPSLDPGALGGDTIYFDWIDLEAIFSNSSLELPADFSQIKWLAISDSNTAIPAK
ncbi:hypothetical protein [Sulfuriroseicoccus oceanibius]|uniref:Uncharacterized protein n=1 Tax=Sulfuriroseicoccus oceanibius TaxID=2707525 RepID=A0A6B3L872_9BACT|nr:hypothetical protein [Sulfuriroseicoccus oceanibius]QQL44963.1 hypothetical protein G3M56_014020 [Sulfuriroseicoccus oceanibius]